MRHADVAELADALDLGSSVFDVGVQVLSSAPITNLFELQIQKSISKMVDFFVCEKIIFYLSVYCLAETPSFDMQCQNS